MGLTWVLLLLGLVSVMGRVVRQNDPHPGLLHRLRRFNERCSNTTVDLTTPLDIEDSVPGEPYFDNSNCVWIINVPENDTILLLSRDFLLEDSYDCRYDYVEIFDGQMESSASVGKFCGRKDVRFISKSNKLFIHFRSDSSVTASGFLFSLSRLPASSNTTCNSTIEANTGTILSPSYPERYLHNVTCLYSIQAPDNKKVKIEFKDFVLERGPCVDDYLTVYDGKSSASSELGTYCGRGAPRSITSSSRHMLLYFRTNDFVRDKGFKLTYKFVADSSGSASVEPGDIPPEYDPDCSSTITVEGMNLTSPIFSEEEFYLQRKRCRTHIQPPEGHGVEIRFRTFDLEESLDCIYDHVNVTYQLKSGGATTTRLCGYQRRNSRCFLSWEKNITIDFKSDLLFEGSGYKAEYTFIAANHTSSCTTEMCSDDCRGYCYNNGGGFHCACPTEKVPPDCVQNITWIKQLPENLTRYEGSNITFSCKVNHPHTITVWDSNDFMLPNETKQHIRVHEAELKITEARVDDGGRYTCTVQAGDWLMSQTINLKIKPEEEFCGSASDEIINPNSNAAIGTIAGKNSTKAPDVIPWQVHLWDKTRENHHCGGVLISERYVLTAAHCVEGHKAADFNHNNIRVSVGTLSCKKGDAEVRKVARYKTHPNYNTDSLKYDFALLELDRPVLNKSDAIYPVCLPTSPGIWDTIQTGYRGIISGCGKDSKGEGPRLLHMADVPIVDRSVCREKQLNNEHKFTDDMFCAGYEDGDIGDACEGDSGGPFVAQIKGRWTLLGLISFGRACAEEGEYGYYANVSYALKWIRESAPVCGRTRFIKGNYESGRILHGEKALPKQFPWQAAVFSRVKRNTPEITCSATMISNKWAVTAKHCFERYNRAQIRNLRLVIGDLTPSITSKTDPNRKELTISKVHKREYDFALLELRSKETIKYSDYFQTVCLPSEDEAMPVEAQGWVAGWGRTSKEDLVFSDHLLYASLTKVNHTFCKTKWQVQKLSKGIECFSGKNDSIQAGPGDSGGGLIWKYRGSNILSAVHTKGAIMHNVPGQYLDIQGLVPWIKKKMGWTEDEE